MTRLIFPRLPSASHAFRCGRGALFGTALVSMAIGSATPLAAEDFYKGKQINFYVGGEPGGGYDTYARVIARHLPRYIAGEPSSIVVQNMPGAGSAKAAEYIFTVAAKDGTAIAAIYPGAVAGPLLDPSFQLRYDPTKLNYLATANSGTRVCMTFHTSKFRTFEDIRKEVAIFGGSAAGGSTRDYAYMMNNLAGTKLKIVSGYKGTVDLLLAMERGEIEGICGYDWSSIKTQRAEWVRDRKINIILQMGLDPNAELAKIGAPEMWAFVSSDTRKIAELIIGQQVFQRPYIAPPEIPSDRLAVLRDAFSKVLDDKAFLEEADKLKIEISPLSGEKVQQVVRDMYATPKEFVALAQRAQLPPN